MYNMGEGLLGSYITYGHITNNRVDKFHDAANRCLDWIYRPFCSTDFIKEERAPRHLTRVVSCGDNGQRGGAVL